MYIVKSRYYASPDQFGESFVVTSDNGGKDLKLENGDRVRIVPLCSKCERDAETKTEEGMYFCSECYKYRRWQYE